MVPSIFNRGDGVTEVMVEYVNCSLTRVIMLIVNAWDSRSFAILIVVVFNAI